jgi:tRNA-specific 2-thiouridylase
VQVRAHGTPVPCIYSRDASGKLKAELTESIFGLAPGQAMVIYDGDRVVCSATISETK